MRIFLDDTDFMTFEQLLGEVVAQFAIECWNYCVMPNHYHATLRPSRPNLSAALKQLNSEYAQWWNRRHGRVGHVFQGRFKDQVVDREEYLRALSRYVALNPVRAGLVSAPEEWRWGSYRALAGVAPAPSFLFLTGTRALFEADDFATFVATHRADDLAMSDEIRSSKRVLGSIKFRGPIESALRAS
jgi:REP element-mobilizing transposase RayT